MDSAVVAALIAGGFAVVTLAGTVFAQLRGFRRTREELDRTLAQQRDRTLNERFATAADRLGNDKPPAVRLAGAYAMAGLADDWPENRQTCVDVLCAYLRLPYDPDPGDGAEPADRAAYRANREVRHTIIRVIGAHLHPDMDPRKSWQGLNLDFTEVVFDGGDFAGARFSGIVRFDRASFSGGVVDVGGAEFSAREVRFRGAKFSGATADFSGAEFSGGKVRFGGAEFSPGTVNFHSAVFSGATVDFGAEFSPIGKVRFGGVKFSGARADFSHAEFSGGTVSFEHAEFSRGWVDFSFAKFSGATARFRSAEFCATVDFTRAEFSGSIINFRGAKFSGGTVSFRDAEFSKGIVHFGGGAKFSATVHFSGAKFSGSIINFRSARFTDGIVDFPRATFSGSPIDFGYAGFDGGTVDFRNPFVWAKPPMFDRYDTPPAGLMLPPASADATPADSPGPGDG